VVLIIWQWVPAVVLLSWMTICIYTRKHLGRQMSRWMKQLKICMLESVSK